nr:mycofactocin system FadH/OYE family oxidoreductase 1 [Rhabdothermincola salaria]
MLEPVALGPVTAPNRILFGPHETNLGRGRAFSERHLAYYERRLAGGCGVVVAEEASVHPSDWPYERAPLAGECGPGWAVLAEAAHRHGAVALAAIGHAGGQGSSAYSQRELWAPSAVPEVNSREVPKVMEAADIDAVVAGFGDAASLAASSGLHGVEVNAGQYSLVRQFLSGLTNMRGDDYGADRLRFAREVLAAVRAAIGPDRVLGMRLSCDELAPWAGLTPESAAEVAAALAEHVDYLVVVRGSIFSVNATRPDGHTEPGFNLDLVRQVREVVHAVAPEVVVVAQGSIVDPAMAEAALAEGRCDAVEMTRAQIADAELVAHLRLGPERVRPCILCNQVCQVRDARNPLVTCVGDPRSGHETVDHDPLGARTGTGAATDVLVVGGGVTGLEAARVLAERGHTVRLVERTDRLGGSLRVAAAGAGRHHLARLADWLDNECRRLGVVLELDTDLTPDQVEAASAAGSRVVLATGGTDVAPAFDTAAGAVVRSAGEVLAALGAGDVTGGLPDGPVLVWDPLGGPIGVSVAESLALGGRPVEMGTPDVIGGQLLSRSGDLAPANVRLAQLGVTLHKRVALRGVDADGARLEDRYTSVATTVACVAVVDASHRVPDLTLWAATGERHARAGDAIAPRTVHEAVLEARRAALAVEGIGPDPGHGTSVLTGALAGGPVGDRAGRAATTDPTTLTGGH